MGFNSRVVLAVAGIFLTVCLLAYCLLNTQFYATMLVLSLMLIFQVVALLRYITTTNRQLTRFLLAVRHADFSQSFYKPGLGSSFSALSEAFDDVIKRFQSERSDKESQAIYLHAFVEQIPIAVLALENSGRIQLCNGAFRRLVQAQAVTHLHQVAAFNQDLAALCQRLQPGREESLQLTRENEPLTLTLSCAILRNRGQQEKLISIQNIQSALDTREMQAWQNLIRVMTHEIMNSLTPITSLADTASQGLKELPVANSEIADDIAAALHTISSRGQGLMRFVESYRSLTRLPKPNIRTFRVDALFASCAGLMAEQARQKAIDLHFTCKPQTLELHADPELLEQALINLLRNAIEACEGRAEASVTVNATQEAKGRIVLSVSDNGCGIDPQQLDNIFIPFFSTKRAGSGIGMSIVKQIVQMNDGSVRLDSVPGQGTTVTLKF